MRSSTERDHLRSSLMASSTTRYLSCRSCGLMSDSRRGLTSGERRMPLGAGRGASGAGSPPAPPARQLSPPGCPPSPSPSPPGTHSVAALPRAEPLGNSRIPMGSSSSEGWGAPRLLGGASRRRPPAGCEAGGGEGRNKKGDDKERAAAAEGPRAAESWESRGAGRRRRRCRRLPSGGRAGRAPRSAPPAPARCQRPPPGGAPRPPTGPARRAARPLPAARSHGTAPGQGAGVLKSPLRVLLRVSEGRRG